MKEIVTGLPFDHERVAPPFAEMASDLDALRTAVVDAASVSGALWLSYLFVLFYFLIAAGGVTHTDLFLENAVKLLFLNVDLPLKGFFSLGPLIFLIVHTYVLLHFVVLAGKVRAFDAALIEQVTAFDARASLRRQLPTNIFVQFLAGPREVRLGLLGVLLWLVAVVSLLVGPVAVLLFFEIQFLPYHSELITWLQRMAVAADLLLLWKLWPLIASRAVDSESGQAFGWRRPGWFTTGRVRFVLMALCATIAVGVPVVTTFPGETIDVLIPRALIPLTRRIEPFPILIWARKILVEGEINPKKGIPESWFSNRLVLPGVAAGAEYLKQDTDGRIVAVRRTVSLRGRDFRRAVMPGAKLTNVDLTASVLREAVLDDADLRGAQMSCAKLLEDRRDGAAGVEERGTETRECTELQGASLNRAQLKGVSLDHVPLQGASLVDANLLGASLFRTQLQGASLDGANLQGARLTFAGLQAASLVGAKLQGATLSLAHFEGAGLDETELQGASTGRANFEGASVDGACVWRLNPKILPRRPSSSGHQGQPTISPPIWGRRRFVRGHERVLMPCSDLSMI